MSVFRKERGCPNGRSYASSRRDRQPRLSLFFRPRHQPLPTSDAPRVTASHLAINTHHCCRVGHTRPGAGGNPRRSSLPRTNRETPQSVCFPGPVVASAVHDTTPSAHSPRLPRLHKVERESFLPSKDEASFCTPVASHSILWGYAPVLPLPFINWLLLITFKHLKFLSLC